MATEKKKIMSISVEPDLEDLPKLSAKKKTISVSQLFRDLVRKYLPLFMNEGDEIPVVLKIPSELRGNEAELRSWLNQRVDAVVKALAPATTTNDPSSAA
jgi:hypothetical protein